MEEENKQPETEETSTEKQITIADVLGNHEQRLKEIEAYLFRVK